MNIFKSEKWNISRTLLIIILAILIGLCIFLIIMLLRTSTKEEDILLALSETAISGALTFGSLYFAVHFQERNHLEQLKQQSELFIKQINENKLPYFVMEQEGNPTAIINKSSNALNEGIEFILDEDCFAEPKEYRVYRFVVYNTSSAWAINIKVSGNTTINHCKPNDSFRIVLCLSSKSPPKKIDISYNDCRGIFYKQELMIIDPNSPPKRLQLLSQIPTKKEYDNED